MITDFSGERPHRHYRRQHVLQGTDQTGYYGTLLGFATALVLAVALAALFRLF